MNRAGLFYLLDTTRGHRTDIGTGNAIGNLSVEEMLTLYERSDYDINVAERIVKTGKLSVEDMLSIYEKHNDATVFEAIIATVKSRG